MIRRHQQVVGFFIPWHATLHTKYSFNFDTLLFLKHSADLQDKVRSELDEIFGDSDRPCTQEDVSAMKYLDCCIKESMRIYSSGPFIIREVTEPINIG